MIDSVDPFLHTYDYAMRKVDLQNTRSAKKVLVNSKYVREVVRDIYQVEACLSYHGVDIDKFRPVKTVKQDVILSVGSLTPLKGFDFLIQSVACIGSRSDRPLVIASNFQVPQEKQYLGSSWLKNWMSSWMLHSTMSVMKQLVSLYNSARLTVYSPIREPFGLVSLESMACGTPVVAVREGGVQEAVLHEQTGLTVERDPIMFAEAIQTLLANPEMASRYGRNGREHVVKNWTWDRAVETLEMHLLASVAK
jgi:glycosyltransferase involved in cell wall biosynthesis